MYGFNTQMNVPFDTAIEKITAALKQEGFGVLTDIDMQATFKAKLNIDGLPYRILGACNPPLAQRAIEIDPEIGLLLPCNVVVRAEADGKIAVSFIDPIVMLQLVKKEGIAEMAQEVMARLQRVKNSLNA